MLILGIKIDEISLEQARQKAREFLSFGGQHKIFTPNPEMLVKAQKDEYFREVLNAGDLNLCDGFGLWLVAKILQWASDDCCAVDVGLERIAGVDFMLEICKIAEETGDSVFLLGTGDDNIIRKAAENLQKQFPKIKIAGFDKGHQIIECHCEESAEGGRRGNPLENDGIASPALGGLAMTPENDDIISKINSSDTKIVLVAFGMGKQEKWIHENLPQMPSVKIAMGVGGAFDYISGNVKRAPCWMRKIGLEWMYRLYKQPQRFSRIFNATTKFVFLVIILSIYGKKSGK